MSSSPYGPRGRTKKPASFITPSRIIVLVLLVASLIALAIDLSARNSASAAFDAVNQYAVSEEIALNPQKAQIDSKRVRELTGKEPSGPTFSLTGFTCEDYTWGGVFNTYRVRVYYSDTKLTQMHEVALNPEDESGG